ncbi:MAG: adenylate/guanylate cyclase domain-containing protein [Spirochaetota bacterium]
MENKISIVVNNRYRSVYYDSSLKDREAQSVSDKLLKIRANRWKEKKISMIFLIHSSQSSSRNINYVKETIERDGLGVVSIPVQPAGSMSMDIIHSIIERMYKSVSRANILVLSLHEKDLLGFIIGSLLVYSGVPVKETLGLMRESVIHVADDEKMTTLLEKFIEYCGTECGIRGNGKEPAHVIDTVADEQQHDAYLKDQSMDDKKKYLEETQDAKKPAGNETDKQVFKNIRFPIRTKLIGMVSFILVVSMGLMIALATYFFRNDSEIRVQESNLKLSDVMGQKVFSELKMIAEKSQLVADSLFGKSSSLSKTVNPVDVIMMNDPDVLLVGGGRLDPGSGDIRFSFSRVNDAASREAGISPGKINSVVEKHAGKLSLSGSDMAVQNFSPFLSYPVLAVITRHRQSERDTGDTVMVTLIKQERLIKAIETQGITETFMVNENGDLIAHSDSRLVLAGGNMENLPIVQMMMKSGVANGQTRYVDEDGEACLGSFMKTGVAGIGVITSVPEEQAFAEVYNIQRRNLYILVIVLNLAVLVVFVFSKTLTGPIRSLVAATRKIQEGDYNVDITTNTNDEVGLLTTSFVEMGRGLQEREKMKDAFGKFVNKNIADMVLRDEISLGGTKQDVTVLFTDLRNFTAQSELMSPEEVVEFLNQYLTRMVQCVHDNSGIVDKFIGDAIMALWGTPVSSEDDTTRAVNAALAMRRALISFNRERKDLGTQPVRIGAGINTGSVVAGQIGSPDRMEYTVIGDTVNLASRIEALNKPFGTDILLTENTLKIVKDEFDCVPMEKIKVKGKKDQIQVYAVLGRMDDDDRPRTVEDLQYRIGSHAERKGESQLSLEEEKYEILQ